MKSIYSSFFGRFFGNATKVIIDNNGLTVSVKNSVTELQWHQLTSPPLFRAGWLGQTMFFDDLDNCYQLDKLAYNSEQQYKEFVERSWIASHKGRLQSLLTKVDKFIVSRYLRQSSIKQIQSAIDKEYQRWFPWVESSRCLQETATMVRRLSDHQQADFNQYRESYIAKQLRNYQTFFDSVETNPLTMRQRRACIVDDDNNLLLAGAGTGKTSVMVGRAGYLLKSKQAQHNELLLLAYGRKAANEMDQRIQDKLATNKISASTFHSLGLDIIAQVEGARPNLSHFVEDGKAKVKWLENCFKSLIEEQSQYRALLLAYFNQYYYVEKHQVDFASLGDHYQYLRDNELRSLKGEPIKSFVELMIANWLFHHGIHYQYEANYCIEVKTATGHQYQPSFFLPKENIYIEYYEIDENGETAPFIDTLQYQKTIEWKAQTHRDHNTQCIELTLADHQKGGVDKQLVKQLTALNIGFEMLSDDVMLASLTEAGVISTLSDTFTQLVGLYKSTILDKNAEKKVIADATDARQTEKVFSLLKPIVKAYRTLLDNNNEIDFEDMIIKAINYVQTGQFYSPWRYIMVDEFQDISEPRARLVKALRDNHKDCSVFAVGDDWQAIYRFSGADLSLTTHFSEYFGATTQMQLDQTFRFNNKISQVATDFISKNPAQIKKTIHSHKRVAQSAVSILRRASNTNADNQQTIDELSNGALELVLTAIANKVKQPSCVYLLARFWFQLPDKNSVARLNAQYPLLNIEIQSFHASKGKESDYVVIMGLKSGPFGFPSQKATPAIVDALLAKQEAFQYAEERRLFYVALTRAKHRVYLISDMTDSCVFVKELIEDHDVELNEFSCTTEQAFVDQSSCSLCITGTLKQRASRYGTFYSCSHFPRCSHTERGCEKCASVMIKSRHPGFKKCLNSGCGHIIPLCDQCGAEMVLRKGANGEFWGCRNFKGNDPSSCKNSLASSKIVWPQGAVS